MRTHFRLLCDHSAIDMIDDRRALTNDRGSMCEEGVGRGILPLWIGRREMLTDVAEPRCSQQSVGDSMKDDVGVAVPRETARMRDFDPAEHDRSFTLEPVDVEAHSGSRHHA